ncbi:MULTISPECIES: IclR family transcriptional regulator [unclassified Sinorhizobium]|uniref:IclR family transcriptional regulator n=1 Tax=unclassified Sinorhizobium TaxID=2613772 RepID=UPI003524C699
MSVSSKGGRGRSATSIDLRAAPDPEQLRSTVQSLAKGFRVLEAFAPEREELTLSEVALTSRLDPGTTYRMLNTLVDLGYVERIEQTKRFRLTLKVLDLGFNAIAHQDLRSVVRPVLRRLVNDVSEAVSFGVLDGAEVLYIERVRAGVTRLGVDIRLGTTVPAHQSVIGHSILAFLPDEELRRLAALPQRQSIAALRPTQWSDIGPSLDEIRRDGYALRPSTLSEGLRILAVPVLDVDGFAMGALSVASPAGRMSEQEFAKLALEPVTAAAKGIARAMEASGTVSASF